MTAPTDRGEEPVVSMIGLLTPAVNQARRDGWRFRLVTTPERVTLDLLVPPNRPDLPAEGE